MICPLAPVGGQWSWRGLGWAGFAVVWLWVLSFGASQPALAHAALLRTDPEAGAVLPASPAIVTLTFNEPVNPISAGFQLVDAAGATAALTATRRDTTVEIALPPDLAPGSYAVGWQVISADGHPIAGAVPFTIGAASASTSPMVVSTPPADRGVELLTGLLQGLAYGGLLLAVGLTVWRDWITPLSLRRRVPARLIRAAATLAIGAALPLLPVTVLRQQREPLTRIADPGWWLGQVGPDARWSIAFLVAGLLLLIIGPAWQGPARAVRLAGVALAVGALAVTGHTRSFAPAWLIVTSDLLHVLTAAVWLGGLVALALTLRRAAAARNPGPAEAEPETPPAAIAQAVSRFSNLAGLLIALLALTGGVLGWLILGSLTALFGTGYGSLLLLKVGVAAVVVAIGGWNRLRLVPAVREATAVRAWTALRRTVSVEAALLVVVIPITGFLVNQSPVLATPSPTLVPAAATPAPARSVTLQGALGDAMVMGELTPGRAGANTITLSLTDASGQPVVVIDALSLAFTLPSHELGPIRVAAAATTTEGTYQAEVLLPVASEWEVTISGRTSRFAEPSVTLQLEVSP